MAGGSVMYSTMLLNNSIKFLLDGIRLLQLKHSRPLMIFVTKIIRGLLCFNCNSLIPSRRNLIELFKSIVEYITDPPAIQALGEARMANKIKRRRRKKIKK